MNLRRTVLRACLVASVAVRVSMGDASAGGSAGVAAASRAQAAAATRPSAEASARRFARAVARRASQGFKVRLIDVVGDEQRAELQVTMVRARAARRLTLAFAGDGARVDGFRSDVVAVPGEKRIYEVEDPLVAFLARATPTELDEVCGMYYLGGLEDGVGVDILAYHVVEARHIGWGAPAALAKALADSLDAGLTLVSVDEVELEDQHDRIVAFDFAFAGESSRVIHADVDARGRVRGFEVRKVPYVAAWQTYDRGAELARELRSRVAVRAITVESDPSGDERGAVILGGTISIDADDFAEGDVTCRC